jgi:hypothetical protein
MLLLDFKGERVKLCTVSYYEKEGTDGKKGGKKEKRKIPSNNVRFEVLTAMKITMLFWVVTPCGPCGRYQHFRQIYCLFL